MEAADQIKVTYKNVSLDLFSTSQISGPFSYLVDYYLWR